jgi:lipoate-protein ligase A
MKIEIEPSELSTFERKTAENLYKEKYSTTSWNLAGTSIMG